MARVTIEDCLERVSNRFVLVHLGAKRVIQLRKGAEPLVEAPKNKEVVLALREIAAGAVDFDSIGQIEQDELASESGQDSPKAPEDSTPSQEVKEEASPSAEEVGDDEKTKQEDSAAETE
jgi:DNA-directed RNA polymerase subunit omega